MERTVSRTKFHLPCSSGKISRNPRKSSKVFEDFPPSSSSFSFFSIFSTTFSTTGLLAFLGKIGFSFLSGIIFTSLKNKKVKGCNQECQRYLSEKKANLSPKRVR